MKAFFRGILIALSVACLLTSTALFWKQHKPNKYKFPDFEVNGEYGSTKPSHISYKDISLPITTEKIGAGIWPVSDDGLVYLDGSGVLGQPGNAVIYGHNWPNLLGFLKSVKSGDTIHAYTHDNKGYKYSVEFIQEVTPDQVHILSQSEDSRLTLYTCSGFLDSKRLVVVAKLVP